LIAEPQGDSHRFTRYDELILQFLFSWQQHTLLLVGAAMPIDSFMQPGAFDSETVAAMSEAFDAACEKLGDTDQPEVGREAIAGRIMAAARLGERDPARLLEAALARPRGQRG
jgi:hypothetical protein